MAKNNYNVAVDLLRIISILAVILIHTTTRSLEVIHFDLKSALPTLFLNQAARFAVPMFFLISGFTLELSFKSNYIDYFKKRVSKIMIPYVFWSAIYYLFIYTKHADNFGQALLSGSASYQLYFIPTLLVFYFMFPIIHNLFTNKYVLLGLGILQIYLLNSDYRLHGLNIYYPINIAVLNFYLFLLGIATSKYQEKLIKILKFIWPVLLIIAAYLTYFVFNEGFKNYYWTHNIHFIYSQWRPSIMLYTITLSGGLYWLFNKLKFLTPIVQSLSQLSFFVFFIHIIVLEFIWKYLQPNNNLIFFGLVAIGSFTVAWLVHKIPHVFKLTG